MASPTTRALALLELLQSHDALSGTELARRLAVDSRTLRRYITKLQALGIPVESERGRYGAYRLKPGFKLPPMMFSDNEAVALSLGLLLADKLGISSAGQATQGPKGTQGMQNAQGVPSLQTALTKLQRVMPLALRSGLQALSESVAFNITAPVAPIDTDVLLRLSHAAHTQRRVRLVYCAANGERTDRELNCYGLGWQSGRWYAVGHCHLRADLRSFRLDRMESVTALKTPFTPPANFDAVRHLAMGLATIPRAHAITVRLKTDLATARSELFDAIGLCVPQGKHMLMFSQADDLAWYARQLAGLSFDFEVVQPARLRRAVKTLALRLNRLAAVGG